MTKKLGIVSILVTTCLVEPALAQDSHYWTHQYGSRSALMGGAVVGGVDDTSACYYNPGALAQVKNESLSVSATGYQYESISIKDGAAAGNDLDSDKVRVIPLLVAGMYRFEDAPNHTLGYSLTYRQRHNFKTSARQEAAGDFVTNPFFPGAEEYIGQFTTDTDLMEVWGGLTYSYKIDDHFSIGLTNFLAYRDQSRDTRILARAINTNLNLATTDTNTFVDYTNFRALWKVGLSADFSPLKAGLTLTTPSVNLGGDGDVAGDITVQNIDFGGVGIPLSFTADDRQDNLDSEYRSPLSVSAGMQYDFGGTILATSVEYFNSQNSYDVLSAADRDFLRPGGVFNLSSKDFLTVKNSADSVWNAAIGVEQRLSDDWRGFFSFRTDFSNWEPTDGINTSFTDWDIYHFTVGTMWKRQNSELALGIGYSFARNNDFGAPINLDNPSESTLLVGESQGGNDATYDSLNLLIGYTYFF